MDNLKQEDKEFSAECKKAGKLLDELRSANKIDDLAWAAAYSYKLATYMVEWPEEKIDFFCEGFKIARQIAQAELNAGTKHGR